MAEKEEFQMTLPAAEIDAALIAAKSAITYQPQNLTPEQQKQARENIGAGAAPVVLDALAYSEGEGGNSVMDYVFGLITTLDNSVAYTPDSGDYDSDEVVEAVKRLVADVPTDRPCYLYLPYIGMHIHIASVMEREDIKEISFTFHYSDANKMRSVYMLINSNAVMSCYKFHTVYYPEPEE